MDELLRDLRYALRQLRRNPGFALVVIMTLALGIGANTAIFSVVDGVLIRPLPWHEPERLTLLWGAETGQRTGSSWASYPDFIDFEAQVESFEELAAWSTSGATLTGLDGEPSRVSLAHVTHDLFPVLGVGPAIGRGILPEEDRLGAGRVAVLSHGFWLDRLGGDPEALNRPIFLDGTAVPVVGVMPADFTWGTAEVFLPLVPSYGDDSRGQHRILPLARLDPAVSLEQADAEVGAVAARLEEQYPEWNSNRSAYLQPLHESAVGSVRSTLWAVFGMVGLVLLIACANVANLLLARATERGREVAVRSALGAGRLHLLRQLGTESFVLTAIGGVAGVAVAAAGLELLQRLSPAGIPRLQSVALSLRVLGFATGLTILTGLFFGLLPSLQAMRSNLQSRLKEGGRFAAGTGRRRVSQAVVVVEVALAVVAVAAAGLLVNSFLHIQRVDPGYTAEEALVIPLALPEGEYWGGEDDTDGARSVAFYREAEHLIEAIPGVTSVASAYQHPLSGSWESSFQIPGVVDAPQGQRPEARIRPITPGYFRTVGMRLLEGRDISERDDAGAPGVVIVNESFERAFFPAGDALGHRVVRGTWWPDLPGEFEIIGVVADVKMDGLTVSTPTSLYLPHAQFPFSDMNLVVAAAVDPRTLLRAIRREIWSIDPDLPIQNVQTMGELRAGSVASERFRTTLVGLFAAVALVLSAIGIYGVLSYSMAQRTKEVGLRMSLGARAADVVRLVVRQGMGLTAVGLAIGVGTALLVTGLLSNLLFEVSPTDPATFVVVAVLLGFVALLACLLPAVRATRVDPMVALRAE